MWEAKSSTKGASILFANCDMLQARTMTQLWDYSELFHFKNGATLHGAALRKCYSPRCYPGSNRYLASHITWAY